MIESFPSFWFVSSFVRGWFWLKVVARSFCLVKERHCGLGPGPGPPTLATPPRAPQAPGTKTRNKQTSRGNFPLPWKQSRGGLERRVESQECQVEMGQTGRRMITSLPCREHLRTPRPDVLVLHSPWCDKIPITIMVSAPGQPAGGEPAALVVPLSLGLISSYGRAPAASALSAERVFQRTLTVWAPAKAQPPGLASPGPASRPLPVSESPTSFLCRHLPSFTEETGY